MFAKLRTRTALLFCVVSAQQYLSACGVDAPVRATETDGGDADGSLASGGATGSGGRGSGNTAATGGRGSGGDPDDGGTGGGDASLSSGGSTTGNGGSITGNGGSTTGSGGSTTGNGGAITGSTWPESDPACECCMQSYCTAPEVIGGGRSQMAALCTGEAKAGCDALIACIERTRCDRLDIDSFTGERGLDIRTCYCGGPAVDGGPAPDYARCFAATPTVPPLPPQPDFPRGECKAEIEALAGTIVPSAVGSQIFDQTKPLGAVSRVLVCKNLACVAPQVTNFETAPCCSTCGPVPGVAGAPGVCVPPSAGGAANGAGGASSGGASSGGASSGGASSGGASSGGASSGGASSGGASSGGASSGGAGVTGLQTGDAECDTCVQGFCGAPFELIAAQCTGANTARCSAVLECANSSGCAEGDPDEVTGLPGVDLRSCYCGAGASFGPCFGATQSSDPNYPHGACRAQIEALAETASPSGVGTVFFDSTKAMGAVTQLFVCRNLACVSQQRDNGEPPLCVD